LKFLLSDIRVIEFIITRLAIITRLVIIIRLIIIMRFDIIIRLGSNIIRLIFLLVIRLIYLLFIGMIFIVIVMIIKRIRFRLFLCFIIVIKIISSGIE